MTCLGLKRPDLTLAWGKRRRQYTTTGEGWGVLPLGLLSYLDPRGTMPLGPCKSCQSGNQAEFPCEVNIHFPGITNLDRRSVLVIPVVLVCLKCGFAEFVIGESELKRLVT